MFFKGEFNLPDEVRAHFAGISDETPSKTWNFLTTKNFKQLVSERIQKKSDVSDLIIINYDELEMLCIEKHLVFFRLF